MEITEVSRSADPELTSHERVDKQPRHRRGLTILAWTLVAATVGLILATIIFTMLLRQYHLDSDYSAGFLDIAGDVALLVFPAVGALIVTRRPGNTIGWLFVGSGAIWAVYVFTDSYATYGTVANSGSLPATTWVAWITSWTGATDLLAVVSLLPLIFPNGHLPSPRWRPVLWITVSALIGFALLNAIKPGPIEGYSILHNPLGLDHGAALQSVIHKGLAWTLLAMIVVAAVAAIVRFRRATGEERKQLEWFTYATAMAVVTFAAALALSLLGIPDVWVGVVGLIGVIGIPVATGVAIFKYRLYAIELIIKRTVVYSILSTILAAIYVASIILLQQLLSPFANGSDEAVAGSTLLVAAMFRPARIRVQANVDRRFYRGKYDADRTLDAFNARLRRETDLDSLTAELCGVVYETMQTDRVSLWLRPAEWRSNGETASHDRSGRF